MHSACIHPSIPWPGPIWIQIRRLAVLCHALPSPLAAFLMEIVRLLVMHTCTLFPTSNLTHICFLTHSLPCILAAFLMGSVFCTINPIIAPVVLLYFSFAIISER
jgi:hypothetical protein